MLDEPGLERHAIKVVSALLRALPQAHRYRVIFMTRPIEEIVRSQAVMIARRGAEGTPGSREELIAALQQHRDNALATMRRETNVFSILEIAYPALVANPSASAARVAEFLGPDLLPHPERLAGVVRPELHRIRAAPGKREG